MIIGRWMAWTDGECRRSSRRRRCCLCCGMIVSVLVCFRKDGILCAVCVSASFCPPSLSGVRAALCAFWPAWFVVLIVYVSDLCVGRGVWACAE
jgi:hypothetical protein